MLSLFAVEIIGERAVLSVKLAVAINDCASELRLLSTISSASFLVNTASSLLEAALAVLLIGAPCVFLLFAEEEALSQLASAIQSGRAKSRRIQRLIVKSSQDIGKRVVIVLPQNRFSNSTANHSDYY